MSIKRYLRYKYLIKKRSKRIFVYIPVVLESEAHHWLFKTRVQNPITRKWQIGTCFIDAKENFILQAKEVIVKHDSTPTKLTKIELSSGYKFYIEDTPQEVLELIGANYYKINIKKEKETTGD